MTMLIGCHGLVWSGSFDTTGLETAIRGTAEAGFDLIEIPLMDPDGFDVDVARGLLASHGLAATASLGLTRDRDLSSEDAEVSAAGERLLGRCLEVLSDLGGTHLVGVIHSAMQKFMEPATPLNRRRSQEALVRLGERAKELGIILGIEVVNRYESNLFNTARQALAFVEGTGANTVVHLDTYHMNIEEPDMFTPVLACADRLGYVHIGESHRGYLGSGTVDLTTFFRALGEVGYDGPIVFESFSSAIVHEEVSRMLGVWRNLWDNPADLAAHANATIRAHLRATATVGMH